MSLLINLLYQQQLIAQRNNAIYNTMAANQAQMNLLTGFSGNDILDLSTAHKAEQQLTFTGLINSLRAKIANAQLKAMNKDK